MENKKMWITFPDGYSCDLKCVRTVTKVQKFDSSCSITLRFDGTDKSYYEWEFIYDNFVESKEELLQKVERLRERLVFLANDNEEPLRAMSMIDLKKKELDDIQN